MRIVEMWIVNRCELLVKLENGDYFIGRTSNIYGFDKIGKDEAEEMINLRERENEL